MSLSNHYPHVTPSNKHISHIDPSIQVESRQVLQDGINICIYSYIKNKKDSNLIYQLIGKRSTKKMIINMSTIMLDSSCGSNTMKIKREIHQATTTNP